MDVLLGIISGLATGSLGTLLVRSHIERKTESRVARRAFYTELLTMMVNRRRVTERVCMSPTGSTPDDEDFDDDRIDQFDAGLLIDATPEVRDLSGECTKLLHRFWTSYTAGAPISVDEHGLFTYGDMQGVGDTTNDMTMRLHLGSVHDELAEAIDNLAAQIRRELHGGQGS